MGMEVGLDIIHSLKHISKGQKEADTQENRKESELRFFVPWFKMLKRDPMVLFFFGNMLGKETKFRL